jgi:hypothetical protein
LAASTEERSSYDGLHGQWSNSRSAASESNLSEDPLVGGYRFRLYAQDGDDLSVREFSEPNWKVGDTVALRDRVYRVSKVVYLDDDGEVRGMLMLEETLTLE